MVLTNLFFLLSVTHAYKYCIIGAGPGGVQIGYFLQKSKRDYIIFERSDKAGNFNFIYTLKMKVFKRCLDILSF